MRLAAGSAFVLALVAAPALAADPPYLKLAQALGTPHLAYSQGPADKTYLLLKFTPDGESTEHWTKMTTITILKLPANTNTQSATRDVILALHDRLRAQHVHIATFDESPLAPVTCYFAFDQSGQDQRGIVYSPAGGFVVTAQVGSQNGGLIATADVKTLKEVVAQAR